MENEEKKPSLKKGDRVLASPAFWDVNMNSNGKPFAKVKFSNGLVFIGYLTDAAIENTSKNLAILGFNGQNPYDLKKEDALDRMVEVECTVGVDLVTDKDGKQREVFHVAFINEKFKKSDLDASQIAELKSIDMRGYLAGLTKERTKPNPTPTPTNGSPQRESQQSTSSFPRPDESTPKFESDQAYSSDDIPF